MLIPTSCRWCQMVECIQTHCFCYAKKNAKNKKKKKQTELLLSMMWNYRKLYKKFKHFNQFNGVHCTNKNTLLSWLTFADCCCYCIQNEKKTDRNKFSFVLCMQLIWIWFDPYSAKKNIQILFDLKYLICLNRNGSWNEMGKEKKNGRKTEWTNEMLMKATPFPFMLY